MNIELEESRQIVEKIGKLSQEVGNLVQKMENLKDENRNKVRDIFLLNLSPKWAELSPCFQKLTRWEEIVKLQKDLKDFVAESKKVILSPERAEIIGLLKKWQSVLNLKHSIEDWVEKSLDESEEQNLQSIR